jgi:hypothetical protein
LFELTAIDWLVQVIVEGAPATTVPPPELVILKPEGTLATMVLPVALTVELPLATLNVQVPSSPVEREVDSDWTLTVRESSVMAVEFLLTVPTCAFIWDPEEAPQVGVALKVFERVPPPAPMESPVQVRVWGGPMVSLPPPAEVTVYPVGRVTVRVAPETGLASGLVMVTVQVPSWSANRDVDSALKLRETAPKTARGISRNKEQSNIVLEIRSIQSPPTVKRRRESHQNGHSPRSASRSFA